MATPIHHIGGSDDQDLSSYEDDEDDGFPRKCCDRALKQTTVVATNIYADSEDNVKWSPLPFDQSRKKRKTSQGNCWGCQYGHLVEDQDKHPAAFGLWKLFAQKYGKIDNDELFSMMNQYFEYYIRKPSMDDGEDCAEWPVDIIKEHVLDHMNDPVIEIGEQIKNQRHVRDTLLDKLYVESEDGERKVDLKVAAEVRNYSKSITDLYKCAPCSMLFYNKQLKIASDDA